MTEKEYLQQGNKKNPLGMIPRNWKILRLGDMCYNKGDYGLNAPAIDYSNNMPTYLRITDIDDNGKFRKEDIKSVDNPMAKDYYLKDGDIVFARTGATVGKTYLYNLKDGQLVYAGFLIKFSPNRDIILPYYLKIYTETNMYKNWVAVVSQRSGQPGINASEYCSFKMLVPPIDEQKRIVEVLSEWDKAIELQTKLIEKLELRKRALMQRLLTGRVRLNGFSGKWQTVSINSFATEMSIKNKDNETLIVLSCTKYNGLVPSFEYFGKQIYPDDVSGYKIVLPKHFAYATNHIEEGSIGYQTIGSRALISPMYTVFSTNSQKVNDIFLYALLKTPYLIYLYKSRMEGSINRRGGLRWESFSSIKVKLPPLMEQMGIAEVLLTADKEIEFDKQKLSLLLKQKQGLMQQLLTGKKRVK